MIARRVLLTAAALALAATATAAPPPYETPARVAYLIEGGRADEAEPRLKELRRRGSALPAEALERVADALEENGRLREAMRWFTIGLRDLDPQHDLPEHDEEFALIGRWRVRQALELPPDHYDDLARTTLELRRAGRRETWD